MDESSVCTISVKLGQSAFAEVSVAFRVDWEGRRGGPGHPPDIYIRGVQLIKVSIERQVLGRAIQEVGSAHPNISRS